MYTRNYSRVRRMPPVTPPPDYSGTSVVQEADGSASGEQGQRSPSVFSPPAPHGIAERRFARVPLEDRERYGAGSGGLISYDDPRYAEPPAEKKPEPAEWLSGMKLHEDDILLLSVILLLLSGGEDEVRGNRLILLALGYLFLSGLGGREDETESC